MIWELAPSWAELLGLLTAYVLGAYVASFGQLLVYRQLGRRSAASPPAESTPTTSR